MLWANGLTLIQVCDQLILSLSVSGEPQVRRALLPSDMINDRLLISVSFVSVFSHLNAMFPAPLSSDHVARVETEAVPLLDDDNLSLTYSSSGDVSESCTGTSTIQEIVEQIAASAIIMMFTDFMF